MLNNGFKNSNVPVKGIDRNVLLKEAEKLAHWKEHFESILNRPEPEQVHVTEIPSAVEDSDICLFVSGTILACLLVIQCLKLISIPLS